jgi:hydrogenase small subunit
MNQEEFIHNRKTMSGESFVASTLYHLQDLYYRGQQPKIPVVWVEVNGCGGNTISLLNTLGPDLYQVLQGLIDLRFSNTLMLPEGDAALQSLREATANPLGYILVIEGAIARGEQGRFNFVALKDKRLLTGASLIAGLGPKAKQVIAIGTCAAFGGPTAAFPNPTNSVGASQFLSRPVVNVSGCPVHPDWFIGTLAHLLLFGDLDVDEHGRPLLFYGETVHLRCTRRSFFERRIFAKELGDPECMFELGCKGPITHADCPVRQWNSYLNWPVEANTPCIGCTEPTFPDGMTPFDRPPFALEGDGEWRGDRGNAPPGSGRRNRNVSLAAAERDGKTEITTEVENDGKNRW